MSYIRKFPTDSIRHGMAVIVMVAVITASLSVVNQAFASDELTSVTASEASATPQQQVERSDPEANLPFLFAVFFITWAAFFGYVFMMSRRQKEMQREIEALKRLLSDNEHRTASNQS